MGRPGAAHVPAGWPCPVPSYFAIVNILGDGGEVSLTVILRGYLYGKHQLKGDGVTTQSTTFPSHKAYLRLVSPPKTYNVITNAHRKAAMENVYSRLYRAVQANCRLEAS